MTRLYGCNSLRTVVRSQERLERGSSVLSSVQTGSGAHSGVYSTTSRASSPPVKRRIHVADH